MSPAADETAKIEHDLEILRSRYATFERWARITKWYAAASAVFGTGLVVTFALFHDPFAAFAAAAMIIVVVGGLYLVRDRSWRWIDAVSPAPGWPHGGGFVSMIGPRSEAKAIESMIAEREARLRELRKQHT